MIRMIVTILTSILLGSSLLAKELPPEEIRNENCYILERLVVEWPAVEATEWSCFYTEEKEGHLFEIWNHDLIPESIIEERLSLITTPWYCGERADMDQVLSELLGPYKDYPDYDRIVIEQQVEGHEAFITVSLENEFVFMYRVINTSFGVHVIAFTHQSFDTKQVDFKQAQRILQEYCHLVF